MGSRTVNEKHELTLSMDLLVFTRGGLCLVWFGEYYLSAISD